MERTHLPLAGEHPCVLVVEDSPLILELLTTVLRRSGYTALSARDGEEALRMFAARRPEVVLLDVHLPGDMDGFEVLRRLRDRTEIPIIMITALDDEPSKVRALNWGADDYMVKPLGVRELSARVAAHLRRARRVPGDRTAEEVYDDGLVRIDHGAARVHVNGREVSLTKTEFRLLTEFTRNTGRVLSREDLLNSVWQDYSGGPSDHVKLYVGYLRRKLAEATDVELVETVRGFGYRWVGAESRAPAGVRSLSPGR